jgi:hypothetical protein
VHRGTTGFAEIPIAALHRGDPGSEVIDKVWYDGPGFWLERKEATSPSLQSRNLFDGTPICRA